MQIDKTILQFEDIHGPPIVIVNRGSAIAETNFWDSEEARRGLIFLSWNAGTARVLIPDAQRHLLREMQTARLVIVSHGPWIVMDKRDAMELLFEDDSDAPFAVQIVANQCDPTPPSTNESSDFEIVVWTRGGEQLRFPGKYRKVKSLPSLAPWKEH